MEILRVKVVRVTASRVVGGQTSKTEIGLEQWAPSCMEHLHLARRIHSTNILLIIRKGVYISSLVGHLRRASLPLVSLIMSKKQ